MREQQQAVLTDKICDTYSLCIDFKYKSSHSMAEFNSLFTCVCFSQKLLFAYTQ